MAAIINLITFVVGVVRVVLFPEKFGEMFVQIFISGFVIVNCWPIYEGIALRVDKGRMPTKINNQTFIQKVNRKKELKYSIAGKFAVLSDGAGSPKNGPINIFSDEGEMMGERRSLVYYNSKEKISAKKTRWIMNEYRLPNLQPAIMSDSSSKDYDDIPPCICLDEYQGNFDSWMETIKKRGHDDQKQQFDDEEEDDQDWIENLESTTEVDDEEQQPLQQLPLIHQQFDQHHQPCPQDYDDIPPCIFLDEYQGNFDSWMETIKKPGHDDQEDKFMMRRSHPPSMMSKVEFVEVLDADEELRLVTAGFVEVCHECPYKERTPFLMSWGRRKIRSALKNNRDSSRPPQRQLAQPSRPLMITAAGEDHDDDDEEKVVGNENGAASGRENKEEAEILMSEEESTSTSTSDYYNQDLEVNKWKNKKRKRKEVLEELKEREKNCPNRTKNSNSDYLVNRAYWNVRDFYKEKEDGKSEHSLKKGLMNQTHVYFYVKKSGKNRGAGNGRWNASNGPVNIFSSEGEMMGEKRSLVYYNSKEKIPAKKTRWIMSEYRLPDPQPAIMSDSSSKDPFWILCKIGETRRTSMMMIKFFPASAVSAARKETSYITKVDNVELVPQEVTGEALEANITKIQQQHHEQQLHYMELVPHHHDLPPEFWVNHHDNSSLEVLQEAAPTGRIGSLLLPDQLDDNSTDDEEVGDDQDWIENLESTLEVDDEEQQPLQQLPLIHQQFDQQHQPWPQVLQQHTDDNITTVEDYDDIPPCIFLDEYQGNFDSWMETIKKRGHDDQQQQVYDEEEPSPKRAKARVAN
ncbi:hypothetical protein Scep_025414 [Stephania cephalantha]|uniref:NAC domain-containing protein n=1 Tax=Stephania cephalantha TaxID=152367 RepID=A0AAP0HSF6_9MAGN